VFARNEMTIVVKPGNPEGIRALEDLTDAGIVSLCVETAPCGEYASEILDRAGVVVPEGRVTRGQNVRATLTAVSEGDADAGVVYATDARAVEHEVTVVEVPADENAVAVYPIALVASTDDTALAEAFVSFLLGDDGQAVLQDYGFLAP
jgi:molybdate transport system substrate-binding protein